MTCEDCLNLAAYNATIHSLLRIESGHTDNIRTWAEPVALENHLLRRYLYRTYRLGYDDVNRLVKLEESRGPTL